jgi:GAF domain-containing protein
MNEPDDPWAKLLADQRALLADERDFLANMANYAALLFCGLEDINWAGFYLLKRSQLVLGPFQGRPACVRIELGRGVCGTAAARRETIVVPDVHRFEGHIACDERSRSEVVVPMIVRESVLGVLDLDSPRLGRFDHEDAQALTEFMQVLLASSDLNEITTLPSDVHV